MKLKSGSCPGRQPTMFRERISHEIRDIVSTAPCHREWFNFSLKEARNAPALNLMRGKRKKNNQPSIKVMNRNFTEHKANSRRGIADSERIHLKPPAKRNFSDSHLQTIGAKYGFIAYLLSRPYYWSCYSDLMIYDVTLFQPSDCERNFGTFFHSLARAARAWTPSCVIPWLKSRSENVVRKWGWKCPERKVEAQFSLIESFCWCVARKATHKASIRRQCSSLKWLNQKPVNNKFVMAPVCQ